MPIPEIVGKYNDPIFHQIKTSFNQRSDDFPVLMLPVRLETKFMAYSRVIKPNNPGSGITNTIVQDIYRIVYQVTITTSSLAEKKITAPELKKSLTVYGTAVQKLVERVNTIKEASRVDKLVLRDAAKDLSKAATNLEGDRSSGKSKASLVSEVALLVKAIERIKAPAMAVYEKGNTYLQTLEKLEKSIDTIFVSNTINAASLDKELKNIDEQLSKMNELADAPDFRATNEMIQTIQAKISHIKRQHKSGNVRLTNFKIGYTGEKDLKKEEYELRVKINTLKEKIEKETVPIVKYKETLQTYPIKQLNAKIVKANSELAARNRVGMANYKTFAAAQKEIVAQIKDIQKHAQIPLEGDLNDVNLLKSNYANLKKQLEVFQANTRKIRPNTPAEKAAITKLNSQIPIYLKELQELEPGFKKVENQILAENKIRSSTMSALATRRSVLTARDAIRVTPSATTQAQALEAMNKQLSELQKKIKTSASSTILLPRGEYNQLKSAYFSLRDQVNNVLKSNPLPESEAAKKEADSILSDIENHILDQLVDINDPRDRFYEEYKNKVIFRVETVEVKELWVRFFPDDIAIDNHDERLTEEEIAVAKEYYYEVYSKPLTDWEQTKRDAWRAAASSMGVRRAAYAIRELIPSELKSTNQDVPATAIKPTIETIKDTLAGYVTKTLLYDERALSKLPVEKQLEHLLSSYSQAPARIQRFLHVSNFTPCSETKKTLDIAIANFRGIIDRLSKWSESVKNNLDKSKVEQLAVIVNSCGKVVYEYYQKNLEKLNQAFRPTLTFPEVEKKTKSWDRAGFTESLPDRFVVVTKRDNHYQQIVTGKLIQKPLPVSIDPSGDQAQRFRHLPNGDLEVPGEIGWMFDFDKAVEAGMAVKIPLETVDWDKGFDFVMAYGVQDKDAVDSQKLIDKLFTNHLYSDGGLEYLPSGTATNNTESVKTPYRGLDNDLDGAFDLFFADEIPAYLDSSQDINELNISDGQFFKEALGLNNGLANLIRHHDKFNICQERAVNRALFSATLKYFFRVMVKDLLKEEDILQTMLFMLHHVSGIGNLPVFRIDNQPYGVLPVSPVKYFKSLGIPQKGNEANFIKNLTLFLKQTKVAFEEINTNPLHINSTKYGNDPQGEFMKILGLEPFSKEFFFRFGVNAANRWQEPKSEGSGFSVNWDHVIDKFAPAEVAANYNQLLSGLGHTNSQTQTNAIDNSPIYRNRFTEGNFILGHLVQDPKLGLEKLTTTDKGGNYIDWLLSKTTSQVVNLKFSDLPKANVDGEEQTQYPVLLAMLRGAWVYDSSSYARKAVEKLKDLDVKTLERLVASHIDLVSYRLDAWLTGLSHLRLTELRKAKQTGTYLGAYGFVHDLKRMDGDYPVVSHLPKGLESSNGQSVKKMPDSQGFIHGPSMNHAVTAAVLRAGYNSIKQKEGDNNALAINLTSRRVRMALQLLEGVGNGQETGALLGYMFERALHDKYFEANNTNKPLEMDKYIYRLRRKFPTYADDSVDPTDTTQVETIKAANVVDGLALIDHVERSMTEQKLWDSDKTFVENIINDTVSPIQFRGFPWGLANQLPNPAQPDSGSTAELERKKIRAIVHELDHIADSIDALGDLVTAEGVYQLVRGNHVRASAVLNSISEGKVPMDPEIVKSFRKGVMVTHRAFLQIPLVNSSQSPWLGVPESPKSKVEPSINFYLSDQIGDPNKVVWKASYGDTESSISLADLQMQPIDLVLLITSAGDEGQAELQARCIDYLLQNGASDTDEIHVEFNVASTSEDLSFGEIVSLLQHLGKVIGAARGADARDYRIAEDEQNFGPLAPGIDIGDLRSRISEAMADYQSLYSSLATFIPSKTEYSQSEHQLALSSLRALTHYGFSGYFPTNTDESTAVLAQRIIAAKVKIAENIAFVNLKLSELELEIDQGKWVSFLSEFTSKIFGSGFKILPKITLSNVTDLVGQMNLPWTEGLLRYHSESYLQDWWSGISLVRNRLGHLETVSILGEVLNERSINFSPVQLPLDLSNLPAVSQRDFWLGADYPETYVPDGDRLSLLIFGKDDLQATCCALYLDEWMEIIPEKKETTGIAFHFNQPDARAPQNLLLAVTPEKTGKWDFETLGLCVEEAFNLAKLRSIEPDQLDDSMFAQLLPATATLAFGDDKFARELAAADGDPDNDSDQEGSERLGYYIDYTSVNNGHEPDEIK